RSRSKCRKISCRVRRVEADRELRPKSRGISSWLHSWSEIINPKGLQQLARARSILREAHSGLCDVGFGRTLVIAIDNLVNRSHCNQTALLQENCPVAHRFDQCVRVTGKYEDAGALDQGLHAGLGARGKSCIPGAQPFVEQ